jgi:hypothetical protein
VQLSEYYLKKLFEALKRFDNNREMVRSLPNLSYNDFVYILAMYQNLVNSQELKVVAIIRILFKIAL